VDQPDLLRKRIDQSRRRAIIANNLKAVGAMGELIDIYYGRFRSCRKDIIAFLTGPSR